MKNTIGLLLSSAIITMPTSGQESEKLTKQVSGVVEGVLDSGNFFDSQPNMSTIVERYYLVPSGKLAKYETSDAIPPVRYPVSVIYRVNGKDKFPGLLVMKDIVTGKTYSHKIFQEGENYAEILLQKLRQEERIRKINLERYQDEMKKRKQK